MKLTPGCIIVLLTYMLQGCYTPRYAYSPSAHNVPLLTGKGDAKLGASFSSNIIGSSTVNGVKRQGKANGTDIQGAYAFKKKWALQGNFFSRREINEGDFSLYRDSAVIRYKRNMFELGAGYFKKLNEDGRLMFQFFAGVGTGKFSFTDDGQDANRVGYSKFHRSTVYKFYVQPVWMYQGEKKIAASLSSRFSFINYRNIRTDYTASELEKFQLFELSRGPVLFWEPAFVNAIGFKKLPGVYLEYQVGMSLLMSRRFIDGRFFNFSAGVNIDPPLLFTKKAKPVASVSVTK
jgi:hypothetical protein